ncbi:MAG: hypothetical protein ACTSRG_23530 [Candidatus Helarchaeota archaeon]
MVLIDNIYSEPVRDLSKIVNFFLNINNFCVDVGNSPEINIGYIFTDLVNKLKRDFHCRRTD